MTKDRKLVLELLRYQFNNSEVALIKVQTKEPKKINGFTHLGEFEIETLDEKSQFEFLKQEFELISIEKTDNRIVPVIKFFEDRDKLFITITGALQLVLEANKLGLEGKKIEGIKWSGELLIPKLLIQENSQKTLFNEEKFLQNCNEYYNKNWPELRGIDYRKIVYEICRGLKTINNDRSIKVVDSITDSTIIPTEVCRLYGDIYESVVKIHSKSKGLLHVLCVTVDTLYSGIKIRLWC